MPFTTETAIAAASKPRQARWRDYRNALAIQDILLKRIQDEETKTSEAAQAARVWVDLFGVRRVMLGLGAPKSVPASNDPAVAKSKRKAAQAEEPASRDMPAPE